MSKPEITVRVASAASEIEKLRPFWARVNYHPESDIDFVLMLASVRPEILRLCVLVAYEAEEPIALMVGRVEDVLVSLRLGYLKVLQIRLRQFVFVREGFLGEQTERVATLMVEKIVKALREGDAGRALWCNMPLVGTLSQCVKNRCPPLQREFVCQRNQHWRTRLSGNFEDFIAKRPKKHRYSLRRIGRVFEAEFSGRVRYETFHSLDHVGPFCEAAEQVARTTYQRGMGAGFMDCEENRKRLVLAARKGWLRGYVAFLGKQPLAFWYGERVGNVMYLTWTGFDPAYREYEVGTILFLKMIADLLSCGVTEIDYGLGWAHYKERFGDLCLQEQDVAIYAPTFWGYGVNLLRTLEASLNRCGTKLLSWLKMRDKVKRRWRSGLAAKAAPAEEAASDAKQDETRAKLTS
jgi:hypothetical protein